MESKFKSERQRLSADRQAVADAIIKRVDAAGLGRIVGIAVGEYCDLVGMEAVQRLIAKRKHWRDQRQMYRCSWVKDAKGNKSQLDIAFIWSPR